MQKKLAKPKRGRVQKRARRSVRSAARRPKSTALAVAKKPAALAAPQSIIPKINETVENLERVRRFITKCLNTDLQRTLAKLPAGKELTQKERDRLEIDWGTIPGVDKPFLKQPGAEKFLFWLNLRPHFRTESFELPDGHLEIVSSATVYPKKGAEIVFEGPICSCSTMESNYRFRWAKRGENEPKPDKEEAEKLKAAGLGKWRKEEKWAHGKKTGEVEWVWLDRVENPNIHDERNKVRQIAQKRALVKAVRNMGALSEIFTSDPGEWDIPDEEGDPYQDMDHAPSGRRMTFDGHKPSDGPNGRNAAMGRAEAGEGSKEAAQAVGAQKVADYQARTLTEAQWQAFLDEAYEAGWHKPEIEEFLARHGWKRGAEIPQSKLNWLMNVARDGEDTANEMEASHRRA